MKRISLFAIAIFAVTSGAVQASDSYIATKYRARWSPYTHSLIFGDVEYSPYAFRYGVSGLTSRHLRYTMYGKKYGSSNLVNEHARYSPYAFGYNRSGLITDPYSVTFDLYYAQPYRASGYSVVVNEPTCYTIARSSNVCDNAKSNYQAKVAARRANVQKQENRRSQIRPAGEFTGEDIIAAYLTSKNIAFRTNRSLSIGNKLITVDFQLTDKNIIIKYWNPEEILALKKQQSHRIRYYENYLESYRDFCSEYLNSGGEVHQIITADNAEVLAKLMEYDRLKDEEKSDEKTSVAKAGEEPAAMTTVE